jgi:hypothetical protein
VIVAVAQIVINTADADAAAQALQARGYERKFAERGLANHPAKAHLQAAARTRLDLLHLTPPQPGPAIEITAYDGAPAGRAAYEWDGAGVTATVSDAAASRAFWTSLGFRGDDVLEFPAPLPSMRLALALRERPDAEPATVDADGCVLVTLLSTDVEADAPGADIWTETIDGRALRIGMIRGPGGEPVEILQLPKAKT